jgi:hypothetical protein
MITFGNTSIDINLILVFLIAGTMSLLSFIATIWLVVQGFRVHWAWGLANLFLPFANLVFCFVHPKESKIPLILFGIVLVLLLILLIFFRH